MNIFDTVTIEKKIVKAENLPALKIENPKLYAKIITKFREDSEFHDDFLLDEFKNILELFFYSEFEIYYSGFCSQRDGLSFESKQYCKYQKNWKSKFIENYGNESEFSKKIIAEFESIAKIQKNYFYKLEFKVKRSNSIYYHENTIGISEIESYGYSKISDEKYIDIENSIVESLRTIARIFYKQLDTENDYQNSEEHILDMCIANEYEFDCDTGTIF